MKILAHRISQARKRAEMTQRQLADALGITVQAVSQWENGRTDATPRLKTIAAALGCDEAFLTDDVPPTSVISSANPELTKSIDVIRLPSLPYYVGGNQSDKSELVIFTIAPTRGISDSLFGIEVVTTSKEFHAGDILIFDNAIVPKKGDFAAVVSLDPKHRNFLRGGASIEFEKAGALVVLIPEENWASAGVIPIAIDVVPKEGDQLGVLVIAGTLVERRTFRASD